MCNSLIYLGTTTANVLEGGIIPLDTIYRRKGSAITSENNSVVLRSPGYYKITATITLTAPVADDITIKLQKNGVDVPGLTATTTITTADTQTVELVLSGFVRVFCYEGAATIALINSGVAINTSNVSLDVEYAQ